ncbi:ADP-ribosylglycohydrolase family protein [Galbibacter pacificus]|uniref:ADP-ribosylglycohydrolase family protein n=1 Tax=Galbibacter pacificus TaxID=2996052 RepID=A0ABT6FNF9_9FLAO|nr:ADP-ribosylglycohydrolase family protein [Galbibacter pacificus]MDG3581153.1 ADP-ribosylglycohydrolase family protein [Galbibacter pacificus]MDG3584631.1 ADP-ribosylglycohydrolase family protein [Galbibacter pacificus]
MKTIKKTNSRIYSIIAISLLMLSCGNESSKAQELPSVSMPKEITLTKQELKNKIKGGWAGQTIGVTYGGPAEFRFNGTMIQDYVQLEWNDDLISWFYDNEPGLYDDIYMDLTFVDVLEKKGLDAPISDFAKAFAYAEYPLWHANQAARYNIMNGIEAPASGHWKNSMHADDIDFQIEADFAGLMSPGLPNAASDICDRVGHLMNYGDGYYAGVYVASMYTLAFVSDDVNFIVTEALKKIPSESKYYRAMQDVIGFHEKFPDDWKRSWFEIERSKWAQDLHCPDGIFSPFNIDATVNSAYVLLGLLYGKGDIAKSMEIATRAGQDADCNPSTVAGILGTMVGYDHIPDKWLKGLKKVEDRDFKYTTISLNDVYELSYKHALEVIERNNGKIGNDEIQIICQSPKTLPLEVAYPNIEPTGNLKRSRGSLFTINDNKEHSIEFSGTGIVIKGGIAGLSFSGSSEPFENYIYELEVNLDGKVDKVMKLPVDYKKRSAELYWNMELPKGDHVIKLKWLNPMEQGKITINEYVAFSGQKNTNHN